MKTPDQMDRAELLAYEQEHDLRNASPSPYRNGPLRLQKGPELLSTPALRELVYLHWSTEGEGRPLTLFANPPRAAGR